MNIDRGNIPNDASHYRVDRCERTTYYRWFDGHLVIWGDGQWVYTGETDLPEGAQAIQDLTPVPAWDGQGLPPDGTRCEIRAHKLSSFSPAIIRFASRNVIVWDWEAEPALSGLFTAYAHDIEVRPIRTPEQIEAEERDAGIKEIDRIAQEGGMAGNGARYSSATALWDAGYRKTCEACASNYERALKGRAEQ